MDNITKDKIAIMGVFENIKHQNPDNYQIKIQYVKKARSTWNKDAVGFVARITIDGSYTALKIQQDIEVALRSQSDVILRTITKSETLRKGSGYMSVRGSRVYAAVTKTTLSFWVSLTQVQQ